MPRAKKTSSSFKGWLKDGIDLLKVDEASKERYKENSDRLVDNVADGINRFEQSTQDAEAKLKQGFADFRKRHFDKE